MNTFQLQEMLDNADLLIKEGKISEASDVLNTILLDDPLYGKAHNHLGYIYETKIRDYVKAEEHYKICLHCEPNYSAVYYNYAILLSTLKKYAELEELLKKAEQVPGINTSTIQNEWGILLESQGKFQEAISAYKKVVEQSFDNKTIDTAMDSVARCEKKLNFITGTSATKATPPPGWR